MKLLLTGATGFVGRNILLRAVREEAYVEIIVPVRSVEKLRAQFVGDGFEGIPGKVRPIVGDSAKWNVEGVRCEHVIHAAGLNYARSRDEYWQVNVEGTLRLMAVLPENACTVIVSSLAAAGPCDEGQMCRVEGDAERPINFYGESKLAMEQQVVEKFSERKVLFLRPSIIWGPRDQASLPLFKMVKGPLRFKPGFNPKFFSYISVGDLAEAIFRALNSPQAWNQAADRRFYITHDVAVTDQEIIETASEVMKTRGITVKLPHAVVKLVSFVVDGIPVLRRRIPTLSRERTGDALVDRWVASSKRFQTSFAWKPKENLIASLKTTAEWYRKTGQLS